MFKAKLPLNKEEEILQIAGEVSIIISPGPGEKKMKIGRRYFFRRHCGERLIQVKIFFRSPEGLLKIGEVAICEKCLFHFVLYRRWDFEPNFPL